MATGDHLVTKRTAYWHHGIDAGDGTVVHFTDRNAAVPEIIRGPAREFSDGDPVAVIVYSSRLFGYREAVERACSKVGSGRGEYDLFDNNCEHFASWCVTGKATSSQATVVRSSASGAGHLGRYAGTMAAAGTGFAGLPGAAAGAVLGLVAGALIGAAESRLKDWGPEAVASDGSCPRCSSGPLDQYVFATHLVCRKCKTEHPLIYGHPGPRELQDQLRTSQVSSEAPRGEVQGPCPHCGWSRWGQICVAGPVHQCTSCLRTYRV